MQLNGIDFYLYCTSFVHGCNIINWIGFPFIKFSNYDPS